MTSIRLYPELWQAIFDQLDYEPGKKADLQAVSKASHLFHELAEPLLFTSILLVSGYSEIDAQTIALIRSLSSRMATQQWVRSVRMIGKRLGSGESIQPIADIFVQLDNLRNIRINGMNITDGTLLAPPKQ
ncbi:hypothetical protein FRB94_011077 [Tulasnella sp. JGI-2019a]|nr:hypothetical protein FRB94_011077 [Tulasnella sp. JGI-2019a]